MLLSGVRSSCDMLARNSDLYFEVKRELGGLVFERAARLLDFLVLAFDLDVLLGELLCLLRELLVGLLQFLLLGLQLAGQLLRLLEQPFGLHRRLDAVQHDADAQRSAARGTRDASRENSFKRGETDAPP